MSADIKFSMNIFVRLNNISLVINKQQYNL